ncbi:thiol peroxidase [Aquifex aeolicus]|uniref:Thiol peroxidase n=2 Tax=Aquifex aeolicus (strain VF5) TaxID=224324 RepID=TPX_AQUAE|nr:thiol peroxidase [Aquifex aeolicus]O66780.1 RecName: Full=Thiol peroxidase; Short=Tpx; AltName: Full=Peroxiredoxin tpx; Short=Prx; AltName: Full=Thioredoxin peroxidase; AltName: Full=Thioredoxin-dependent peroxiredoxin [Aquifex aeolicus VF5]AAC06736.1 thiol peroxidase [Aquifex aeolicus VF5]
MARTVNLKGNPVTLVGPELKVGDRAPEAVVVTKDLQEKIVGGAKDVVQVIITVPSLDTPVCETETKKFNEIMAGMEGVDVTVVSMDLPFAQKRFCESFNIQNVTVASDFRYRDMEKYGVLIGEGALKGILARAVFIIDKEGKVAYVQLVPEITEEPNYDEVVNKVKELI